MRIYKHRLNKSQLLKGKPFYPQRAKMFILNHLTISQMIRANISMLFKETPLLAITSETLYLQGETPELKMKKRP